MGMKLSNLHEAPISRREFLGKAGRFTRGAAVGAGLGGAAMGLGTLSGAEEPLPQRRAEQPPRAPGKPQKPREATPVAAEPTPEPVTAALDASEAEIITATLIGEAGGEGYDGMHAVMNVIQNRAKWDKDRFLGVVLRRKQFSYLNKVTVEGMPVQELVRSAKKHPKWDMAAELVTAAIEGKLRDITGGADHYHATWLERYPSWSRSMTVTKRLGQHIFYKS